MQTRVEAKAAYRDLLRGLEGAARQGAMRRLAERDLFFLLVHVLGRPDVDRDWLFARCREVQGRPDGMIDLWAREHYKSTIITFGKTIQDVLNDPGLTVGMFSHTRRIAKGFLRQIKRELETNAALKALFPQVLWTDPGRQAPKWSEDDGIVVRRRGNPKEATVEAWGLVDGQPTGKHFQLVVYDDVVTRESVTTPAMIRKVTEAWELSLNLSAEGGARRYAGTRYHFNDTYRTIIERGAAAPRVYPATRGGKVDGAPVLLGRDVIARKRREMGPYIFGCQMLLDPKADEAQGFNEAWLKFWQAESFDGLNRYILVDPASARKQGSDYTAMMVVGLGSDRNAYVIDMVRDRLNLTGRANRLFALHRKYQPLGVGYERYGMQADIEHVEDRMARENYRFPIKALGGQVKKEDRIRTLIPLFEQGRLYLPETCWRTDYEGRNADLVRAFVDEEYKAFPVAAHDDMLDCLARINDPDLGAVSPAAAATRTPEVETEYAVLG